MKSFLVLCSLVFASVCFGADVAPTAVPVVSDGSKALAWFVSNFTVILASVLGLLTAVSEILSLTGFTKANGVIQAIINGIKSVSGKPVE